jgi:hypothetical protein
MSRSTKKPIYTDGQKSPGERKKRRRTANRRVRKEDEVPSGGSFKKVSESWTICDYKLIARKGDKKATRK